MWTVTARVGDNTVHSTSHLLGFMVGGALGFLLIGGMFLPISQVVTLTAVALSLLYLLTGVWVHRHWHRLFPE